MKLILYCHHLLFLEKCKTLQMVVVTNVAIELTKVSVLTKHHWMYAALFCSLAEDKNINFYE